MSARTRLSVSRYAARAPHWAAHALSREVAGGALSQGRGAGSTPLPKAPAAGASARHHGDPKRLALRARAGIHRTVVLRERRGAPACRAMLDMRVPRLSTADRSLAGTQRPTDRRSDRTLVEP